MISMPKSDRPCKRPIKLQRLDAKVTRIATQAQRDYNLIYDAVLGDPELQQFAWQELQRRYTSHLVSKVRGTLFAPRRAEECVDEFWQHLCANTKLRAFLAHKPGSRNLRGYLTRSIRNFARKEFPALVGNAPGDSERDRALVESLPDAPAANARLQTHVAKLLQAYDHLSAVCFKLRLAGTLVLSGEDFALIERRSGMSMHTARAMLQNTRGSATAYLCRFVGISRACFDKRVQRTKGYLGKHLRHSGYHPRDRL